MTDAYCFIVPGSVLSEGLGAMQSLQYDGSRFSRGCLETASDQLDRQSL